LLLPLILGILSAIHRDSVTVTADVRNTDILQPDPAQRVMVRDQILDANPGRPGAPVSIPGLPIETASGGIKAPQYFAPGVAGDHGEPIAQFIQVGTYLVPNNLSANAHGNGYADPNIMVPAIIESVQTDGGAFNVLEGDHSVDVAATYAIRPSLEPFATVTGYSRDVNVSAGWKWLAAEASYGNGFLDRPEHRQQYKINGLNHWTEGSQQLTVLAIGYYGQSYIPGLVPIDAPGLHDTIDPRQRDQTHTGEVAFNDVWNGLQMSGFLRTYSLSLYSDFGDGLIRQSEFRTEAGANAAYKHSLGKKFSFLAGLDYFREAPREDDLRRESVLVTANNITLNFASPFAALQRSVFPWLRYYAGWRRDEIQFVNQDLLVPANSFNRWAGINSPKATISLLPPDRLSLPNVAFSFGEAFFTNDPRIGTGTLQGSLLSRSHSYQMVVSRILRKTDLRVTLGHITQSASLAKIDPDTGLQFNEGPGVNRYLSASARRYFGWGMVQGSFSKADARDLSNGTPLPEAPRLIFDAVGTWEHLPFRLHARAEFEEVGRKPLGDGFRSVPVREFRVALERSFREGRIEAGVHLQMASGYAGQTTEVLAGAEQVVGVYIPSYAAISCRYRLGR
jgi:hypothetical protein